MRCAMNRRLTSRTGIRALLVAILLLTGASSIVRAQTVEADTLILDLTRAISVALGESPDAFYTQKRVFNLDKDQIEKHWKLLSEAGVLVTEMESSAMYVLASLRGCRAMSLLVVASMDRKNVNTAKGLDIAANLAGRVFSNAAPFEVADRYKNRTVDNSLLDELKEGKL